MTHKPSPYVGLRPFDREDRGIFFGRELEANMVSDLIIAHPLLLLYSVSWAGKTSLINAGVIPSLKSKGYHVLPTARIGLELPLEVNADEVSNVYLFNCLLSWVGPHQADLKALAGVSLRDFLKGHLPTWNEEAGPSLSVLIFDHFEELFTSYPQRWRDRHGFFEQIGHALWDNPLLRVVFVMREEIIASIDPFAHLLPERSRTRFRLERLTEKSALQAVTGPLRGTGRIFAAGAAEKLVSSLMRISVKSATGTISLSGEFVDPVQLQIVCRNIWDSIPEGVEVIDERSIQTFGNVDAALADYYESCIRRLMAVYPNLNEGGLRLWLEQGFVTPIGTRATIYVNDDSLDNLSMEVVEALEGMYIIRAEFARGAKWYELANDLLIKPILDSNKRWRDSLGISEDLRRKLESRASEWVRGGGTLLSESELLEVERWMEKIGADKLGLSSTLSALVRASRAAAEEGRRRQAESEQTIARLKLVNIILLILLVLAVAFAISEWVR